MNKFNARVLIKYQSPLTESDEFGNPISGWVNRVDTTPAMREVIKGSLKDIATREQNVSYMKFVIWASTATRSVLSTDRLIDATSANRIHEIISVYESDDRRQITILTKSIDNQRIYDAS